jgi:hypothetical protein
MTKCSRPKPPSKTILGYRVVNAPSKATLLKRERKRAEIIERTLNDIYAELITSAREWDRVGLNGRLSQTSNELLRRRDLPVHTRAQQSVQHISGQHMHLLQQHKVLIMDFNNLKEETKNIQQALEKANEQRGIDASLHQVELDQYKSSVDKAWEKLTFNHKEEVAQLSAQHKDEIGNLEAQHHPRVEALEIKHEAHVRKLETERNEMELRMKQDIESLATALVERDNYKPINDHKMVYRFVDIKGDIENLTRALEWSPKQSGWSPALLARLSNNVSKLQRVIWTDTVWSILFENIFCSPFRMFGEVGAELEAEWVQTFGVANDDVDAQDDNNSQDPPSARDEGKSGDNGEEYDEGRWTVQLYFGA